MKRIIAILAVSVSSCATSCSGTRNIGPPNDNQAIHPTPVSSQNCDSVLKYSEAVKSVAIATMDSLKKIDKENKALLYQIKIQGQIMDSILITNDTLAARLLHARLIIENIRYYSNIVNRNRSQLKFLLGWNNRVLKDYPPQKAKK